MWTTHSEPDAGDTRLRDLIAKHSFAHRCCCAVTRGGYVLGVLSGEDLVSVNLHRNSYDTKEWHMRRVDWVEAVDIADEAAEAMEWLKRYGRSYLPALDGSRLVGIAGKDRMIEAAMCCQSGRHPISMLPGDREVEIGTSNHHPISALRVSVSTRREENWKMPLTLGRDSRDRTKG